MHRNICLVETNTQLLYCWPAQVASETKINPQDLIKKNTPEKKKSLDKCIICS